MFSKLQYISQGNTAGEQLGNIEAALAAGCKWIQLRFKQADEREFATLAGTVKRLCAKHQAVFIVNDRVQIAKDVNADGVHVGLDDMPVTEVRRLLGDKKIIGGTANTVEHVLRRVKEKCDYVGLGPFRFTTTKEKLSPVLGAEGYRVIIDALNKENIGVPVYAIGGITADDVSTIMDTGVHGIAVSGTITHAADKRSVIQQLNNTLYASI